MMGLPVLREILGFFPDWIEPRIENNTHVEFELGVTWSESLKKFLD